MEHRGVRYTVRAGIERGLWSVAIYPGGVESTGTLTYGTRKYAEGRARSMINSWLRAQSRYLTDQNRTGRHAVPKENNSTNEDRFARQDQQTYSGWSSLIALAIIVIVIGIFFLMFLRHGARRVSRTPGAIAAGQNAEAVMVDLMQPAQASFHQNLVEIHQELVETRLNASVRSN